MRVTPTNSSEVRRSKLDIWQGEVASFKWT